jgi:hypothetical protein
MLKKMVPKTVAIPEGESPTPGDTVASAGGIRGFRKSNVVG